MASGKQQQYELEGESELGEAEQHALALAMVDPTHVSADMARSHVRRWLDLPQMRVAAPLDIERYDARNRSLKPDRSGEFE